MNFSPNTLTKTPVGMLIFLFSRAACWSLATFDEMDLKCALCSRILQSYNPEIDKSIFDIIPGSECMINPSNKICQFIKDISETINRTQNSSVRSNYCQRIFACPPEVPDEYTGIRCETCIGITEYLFHHKKSLRKEAFYRFCTTHHVSTLSFCGDIIEEGLDEFLDDIEEIPDSIQFCHSSHFCRTSKYDL